MSRKAWFGTVGFEMLALAVGGIASDWDWVVVGVVLVFATFFAWLIFPEDPKPGTEQKAHERIRPAFVRVTLRVHRSLALTSMGRTTWSMVMRTIRRSRTSYSEWGAPGDGSGAGSGAGSIGTTGDPLCPSTPTAARDAETQPTSSAPSRARTTPLSAPTAVDR
jgi:hypothetical protein